MCPFRFTTLSDLHTSDELNTKFKKIKVKGPGVEFEIADISNGHLKGDLSWYVRLT